MKKRASNVERNCSKRRGNGKSDVLWSLVRGSFHYRNIFTIFASLNLSDFHRCRRSRKKDTEIFLPVSKPKQIFDSQTGSEIFYLLLSYVLSRTTWLNTIIISAVIYGFFKIILMINYKKKRNIKFVKDVTIYLLNSNIRKYK